MPRRNRYNPLPSGIKLIILEESSQINKDDLHAKLLDAPAPDVTFNLSISVTFSQLPQLEVTASSGTKLMNCLALKLTQIYRQAAENPIIRLAWEIASGGKNLTKSYLIDNLFPEKGFDRADTD